MKVRNQTRAHIVSLDYTKPFPILTIILPSANAKSMFMLFFLSLLLWLQYYKSNYLEMEF